MYARLNRVPSTPSAVGGATFVAMRTCFGQFARTLAKPLANRAFTLAAGVAFRRIEHIDAKSERLVKRGERRLPVEAAADQIPDAADPAESAAAEECPRNRDAGCAESPVFQSLSPTDRSFQPVCCNIEGSIWRVNRRLTAKCRLSASTPKLPGSDFH